MFYIYILYSPGADRYYTGYTNDPKRRLAEHNELSTGKYTSKYRPWLLKAVFPVSEERGVAMQIEKHIKKQHSREYIESILDRGNIEKLIERYS